MPPKTSGKAAVKSGKAAKAVTKSDKKKRKGKRKESYAIYIYKVIHSYFWDTCRLYLLRCWSKSTLTLVSPRRPWASWTVLSTTSSRGLPLKPQNLPITTRGELLGALAFINSEHVCCRSTITSREIQTAVRLLLPGELAKHAVSEGTKAVTKYTSSK